MGPKLSGEKSELRFLLDTFLKQYSSSQKTTRSYRASLSCPPKNWPERKKTLIRPQRLPQFTSKFLQTFIFFCFHFFKRIFLSRTKSHLKLKIQLIFDILQPEKILVSYAFLECTCARILLFYLASLFFPSLKQNNFDKMESSAIFKLKWAQKVNFTLVLLQTPVLVLIIEHYNLCGKRFQF